MWVEALKGASTHMGAPGIHTLAESARRPFEATAIKVPYVRHSYPPNSASTRPCRVEREIDKTEAQAA
jgi:hypothetical protein